MNNKHSTKKANHSSHKKVFDVVRPGKAPASPTSRPVITNQKTVPDDQFMAGRKVLASDPDDKHELMDGKKRIAVKPVISSSEDSAPSKEVPQKSEKTSEDVPADNHQAFGAPVLDRATFSALTQESKVKPEVKTETSPEASEIDAKVLLEQLAVEQVVEPPADEISSSQAPNAPTNVEESSTTQPNSTKAPHAKTIDELLAETGAPQLDTAPESSKPLVSYHRRGHSFFVMLLAIIIGAAVGLAILNFLLDAELIGPINEWPHTDWL